MIKNIPPPQEFYDSGLSLLNFSWSTVINLLIELQDSENFGVEISEVQNAFWLAARQQLTTSLAIAQQGVEFILKGKISETSPFLLLTMLPKDFPNKSSTQDLDFSTFRTIDAQDLIKVHDTFSLQRLPDDFKTKFEELRGKRNVIMHSVNKNLTVQAADVIADILSVYKHLYPDENFISERKKFLDSSPTSELHSTDHVDIQIIKEFSLIVDLLTPQQMQEFFSFDKKQRRYLCPDCTHTCRDDEINPKTALLNPNTATSTILICFICSTPQKVQRLDCKHSGCMGNVLSVEYEFCTTCGF